MSATFQEPTDPRTTDPDNLAILSSRIAALDAINGPRVGDFIELTVPDDRCRNYTRFTHDHGDLLQTGGSTYGQYYLLGGGGVSYSGGLDPGIMKSDLIATPRKRDGSVWFFDKGSSGAGRGVNFTIPFRVYTIREGASTMGIHEVRCPYWLDQPASAHHRYWYLVTKRCMSETAFEKADDLHSWLAANRLVLTKPLTPQGESSHQSLGWPSLNASL